MSALLVEEVQRLYNDGKNALVLAAYPSGWQEEYSGSDLAMLHYYHGSASWKLEDYVTAGVDYAAAHRLLSQVTDKQAACWICLAYGLRQGRMGDAAEAAQIIARTFEEYSPTGIQRGYLLWGWGWNACEAGDLDNGLDLIRRAAAAFVLCGSDMDMLCATVDLAECYFKTGRFEEAMAELDAIESRVPAFGPTWQAAYGNVRAECASGMGQLVEAAYWTLFALEMANKAGSREQMSRARNNHMRLAPYMGVSVEEIAEQAYDAAICAQDGVRLRQARSMCGREVSR